MIFLSRPTLTTSSSLAGEKAKPVLGALWALSNTWISLWVLVSHRTTVPLSDTVPSRERFSADNLRSWMGWGENRKSSVSGYVWVYTRSSLIGFLTSTKQGCLDVHWSKYQGLRINRNITVSCKKYVSSRMNNLQRNTPTETLLILLTETFCPSLKTLLGHDTEHTGTQTAASAALQHCV